MNNKKNEQLGMPVGTAQNRLRKLVMFSLLEQLDANICYQCGERIYSVDELSIEHKIPWLDSENPVELFFDLKNIAFSHLGCNSGSARSYRKGMITEHGTSTRYNKHDCRCQICRNAHAEYVRNYRKYK